MRALFGNASTGLLGEVNYVRDVVVTPAPTPAPTPTPTPDTTPDALTLGSDITGAALGAQFVRSYTVQGVNEAVPVSVTGAQYRINGGEYTSGAGIVSLGDVVDVLITASGNNDATTTATLTIGSSSDSISVTTLPVTTPGTARRVRFGAISRMHIGGY